MVVNINSEGTYDTSHANGACIIKESNTSYKMWYEGRDSSYGRAIYCTSTDGINWSNFQMVIDKGSEGTYDTSRVRPRTVIKESDTSYKMWYSGLDGSYWRIIYCTSTDGITWSNFQLVVNRNNNSYDTYGSYEPCVIKESSSSYKMWYSGVDASHWRILYATSTNGTSWSNYQMVLDYNTEGTYDTSHVFRSFVTKESSGSYKMWYNGDDGSNTRILYATSTDGTSWSNYQMVLDYNQEGTYDTNNIFAPFIIKESSNLYKMWYNGYDGTNYRILYATSEDGKTWTKNVVNRVWDEDFIIVSHDAGLNDSTSNQLNGTNTGTTSANGLIGNNARYWTGTPDLHYIDIGDDTKLRPSQLTFEVIAKHDNLSNNQVYALKRYDWTTAPYNSYSLDYADSDKNPRFSLGDSSSLYTISCSSNPSLNKWFHITGTYDGNLQKIFYNGNVENSSSAFSGKSIVYSTLPLRIGAVNITTNWIMEGYIDELRLSKIARSSDWIKTTYYSNWDDINYFSCYDDFSTTTTSTTSTTTTTTTTATTTSTTTSNIPLSGFAWIEGEYYIQPLVESWVEGEFWVNIDT